MSMEITFELSDTDLEYFNKVMLDAREKSGDLDEATVIANARKLLVEVSHSDTSDFIRAPTRRVCNSARCRTASVNYNGNWMARTRCLFPVV